MKVALAAVAGMVLLACPGSAADPPLDVHAVNAPLAAFAARIAGDAAAVTMVLPEGADPAAWQPGMAELTAMQQADLIVLNGAGFEPWTQRVSLPRARTVETSRGFAADLITVEDVTHSHGNEPEHSHGAIAPNTWLDFAHAMEQAAAVAEGLERARPAEAPAFRARLQDLQSELAALDAEAARIGAQLAGRPVLAGHPGFEYFARRYGLDLRLVDWDAGARSPLAALDAALAAHQAEIMLLEAAPGPEALAALEGRSIKPVVLETGATVDAGQFFPTMARNLANLQQFLEPLPDDIR